MTSVDALVAELEPEVHRIVDEIMDLCPLPSDGIRMAQAILLEMICLGSSEYRHEDLLHASYFETRDTLRKLKMRGALVRYGGVHGKA